MLRHFDLCQTAMLQLSAELCSLLNMSLFDRVFHVFAFRALLLCMRYHPPQSEYMIVADVATSLQHC